MFKCERNYNLSHKESVFLVRYLFFHGNVCMWIFSFINLLASPFRLLKRIEIGMKHTNFVSGISIQKRNTQSTQIEWKKVTAAAHCGKGNENPE